MIKELIYIWHLKMFQKLVNSDSMEKKALALCHGVKALKNSKPETDLRFNLEKNVIACVRDIGNEVQAFEELNSDCNRYRFDREQNFFRYGAYLGEL